MRILGIDYGSKRIGLAISDEGGTFAFPYETEDAEKVRKEKFKYLKEVCQKEGIDKIVIGLPISFSGKEERQAIEVREFVETLKKEIKASIEFENEILSSELAKRHFKDAGRKKMKHKLDASSAAIILQSYLDRIKEVV